MKQTYEEWLAAVERIVNSRTGLSTLDHPYTPLYQLWANGKTADEAAEAVIQEH